VRQGLQHVARNVPMSRWHRLPFAQNLYGNL